MASAENARHELIKNSVTTHFLWPKALPLHIKDWLAPSPTSLEVERELQSLFPDTHPVLFSSARAGLTAVLQSLDLGRADKVWIPGFSSHCVIEAVGHYCAPTPDNGPQVAAALVYHQWGWLHRINFDDPVHVIEDAVDTMFQPGANIFGTQGAHVLWSLSKVLGSVGGGVVFCRTPAQAEKLRNIRATRPCSNIQGCLRLLTERSRKAHVYWNGAESLHGELQGAVRSQVLRLLGRYHNLFNDRLAILRFVLGEAYMKELNITDRLPSNLPLARSSTEDTAWGEKGRFIAGLRSFNMARSWPNAVWKKVAPLPVHRDVFHEDIQQWAKHIELEIET